MYVGDYIKGSAEGLGICLYSNGDFYEGQVGQSAWPAIRIYK